MQIPQELPQFSDKKTLIIVTSLHDVVLYEAYNGSCEELSRSQVEKEQYSDDEGHFERSGDGKTFGSGSVKEENAQQNRVKIQNLIESSISEYKPEDYAQVILFCPDHLKNINTEPLKKFGDALKVVEGNYSKQSIPELLKLI